MRRERIIKAVNSLREALHAAQIRELLRVARTGQQADGVNRTQRILLAYNEFTRHYQQFGDEEKDLMTFFGLNPLLDLAFWSSLIDGEQSVNRKLLSDVDVGAYNVIFVMPKLRELLTRDTDKSELVIADAQGVEREIRRVRVLIAEKERSLTDPQIVINVIRSMDELYGSLSSLHPDMGVSLAIGSIDSGGAKSFDFFGAGVVMDDMSTLLMNVWDRVKYSSEENFRYQIEVAMMAAGFVSRIKEAQAQQIIGEELAQRTMRVVAKSIETLFRSGAYTEEMDAGREVRASNVLKPRTQLIEFKHEDRADVKRDDARPALDAAAVPMPKAADILRDLQDQLDLKETAEAA
ncbi:hypothetical protein JDN40_11120 [Rhodomicrobium vannielii ATCC 17100]|uniref:hypothetical protein n=1 Tax=Rhodomicrobium vannielii TaxID=1069 RepID=UPI001918734A|nr:hypothetical protein [Rhodomicrobium vannielii]MBJ7534655.1 hypothetical protein [Rhodomicrobium vannielii ATCC 17100]